MRKIFFSSILAILFLFLSNTKAQWISNGPDGGILQCLFVNGSNIYSGTLYNGIFKSTNEGSTWSSCNNGLTTRNVYSLAASGSTLFAGSYGGGIFKSTDNGASWTATN